MSLYVALTGMLLLLISFYLLWNSEGNQVCSTAALLEAKDNVVGVSSISPKNNSSINNFFEGCDPTGKVGDFVYINCPVDNDLSTVESSTGVVAHGAYKLSFLTQQYGYRRVKRRQSTGTQTCRTSSNGKNVCTDNIETCYCYDLTWTSSPAKFINRNRLCGRCNNRIRTIDIPYIPNGQNPATGLGSFTEYAPFIPLGNNAFTINGSDISKIGNMPQIKAPQLALNTTVGPSFFQSRSPRDCNARNDLTSCWYSTAFRISSAYSSSCTNCTRPGDLRITLNAYGSTYISAIGRESSYTDESPALLEPRSFGGSTRLCDSRSIFYIQDGNQTVSKIFTELKSNMQTPPAIMRFFTLIINVIASVLIFQHFDKVPYLEAISSPMTKQFLISFSLCIGSALWMTEFSAAWILYNFQRFSAKVALILILALAYTGAQMNNKRKREESKLNEYHAKEHDSNANEDDIVDEATPILHD